MSWRRCEITTADSQPHRGWIRRLPTGEVLFTIIPYTNDIGAGDVVSHGNDTYTVITAVNTSQRSETLDITTTRKVGTEEDDTSRTEKRSSKRAKSAKR